MKALRQTGFTLVEIAIVLVVIGLLLGGILKGQQLINSARVRNLADQNTSIQAAYYGFIDRFRNLPGDMTCASAVSAIGAAISTDNCSSNDVGGNGNGRIENVQEAAAVWAHLSVAGFLNGTFTGSLSTSDATTYRSSGVPTGAIPPNAFQGPIMLAHTSSYMNASSVTRLAYSFGGNIPVPILRDLDQKLDDGAAGTGVLRSGPKSGGSSPDTFDGIVNYTASGTSDDCVGGTAPNETWNVDSSNQNCNGVFLY